MHTTTLWVSALFSITRIGTGPRSMPSSAAAAFESASSRSRNLSSIHARATSRATAGRGQGVHALDLRAHVVRAEDALLDEQRGHRHLQDLVVGEGGVFQVRLGGVMMVGVHVVAPVFVSVRRLARMLVSTHVAPPEAGSSQCS